MKAEKRKVVIVGTGMVGMSYAYCLLNQSVCDELVLIDVNRERAEGRSWTSITAWHLPAPICRSTPGSTRTAATRIWWSSAQG